MEGYPERKGHKKPLGGPLFHNLIKTDKKLIQNGTSALTPHYKSLGNVVEEEAKRMQAL